MTSTLAPAPIPSHTTPLPLPTPPEVVALQALRAQPAVSVLCTTVPGPRMTGEDAARLRALAAAARSRVTAELGSVAAEPLVERLDELVTDAVGRATRLAVALFVSDRASSSWSLSVEVVDRAVVDPTFATRDLVRSLHRTPRHVVLVLTDRQARLFDGLGDSLLPAVSRFPMDREPRPSSHGRAGRHGRGGRVERNGDGGDAARTAWLRSVDSALGAHLALHPAPLVVVGAERLLARFAGLSRNLDRLAGTVVGSHRPSDTVPTGPTAPGSEAGGRCAVGTGVRCTERAAQLCSSPTPTGSWRRGSEWQGWWTRPWRPWSGRWRARTRRWRCALRGPPRSYWSAWHAREPRWRSTWARMVQRSDRGPTSCGSDCAQSAPRGPSTRGWSARPRPWRPWASRGGRAGGRMGLKVSPARS
ncbi:hypothetical protein ACFQX8_08545 [Klenkia terrae]|uniref:baeRF3 domain-containing protein n=1 Tax=Klenkia terrae TaxID=1052259 RepID=UPI003606EE3A